MNEYTEAQLRTYRALQVAAEKVGMNNYQSGLYRAVYRRGKCVRGYCITPEHRDLVDAMPKVLSGEMTAEEGMALINSPDVFRQRFPD